jgi:hypothetical protein
LPPRDGGTPHPIYAITKMGDYTSFLFARPSFLEGMSRALDLGGTLQEYNRSRSGIDADETALRMDWMALEEDIRRVNKSLSEANGETQTAKAPN